MIDNYNSTFASMKILLYKKLLSVVHEVKKTRPGIESVKARIQRFRGSTEGPTEI